MRFCDKVFVLASLAALGDSLIARYLLGAGIGTAMFLLFAGLAASSMICRKIERTGSFDPDHSPKDGDA